MELTCSHGRQQLQVAFRKLRKSGSGEEQRAAGRQERENQRTSFSIKHDPVSPKSVIVGAFL